MGNIKDNEALGYRTGSPLDNIERTMKPEDHMKIIYNDSHEVNRRDRHCFPKRT